MSQCSQSQDVHVGVALHLGLVVPHWQDLVVVDSKSLTHLHYLFMNDFDETQYATVQFTFSSILLLWNVLETSSTSVILSILVKTTRGKRASKNKSRFYVEIEMRNVLTSCISLLPDVCNLLLEALIHDRECLTADDKDHTVDPVTLSGIVNVTKGTPDKLVFQLCGKEII